MEAASSDLEDRALGIAVFVLLLLLWLLFGVELFVFEPVVEAVVEAPLAFVFSELAHRSTISAP